MAKPLTYVDSGVDIDKANQFVDTIKKIVKPTFRAGVLGDIGGFGGMVALNVNNMDRPVLVSSTDGVGTKLKIACLLNQHDTIGIDLVGMCVNDIIVQGAKPLFFLDYLSMGELDPDIAIEVVKGIAAGCIEARCSLIGGETAEMPGFYKKGEYDLAGFAVGIVNNEAIIDGSEISVGDQLIGVASSGLHSNGFSLVRKICFDVLQMKVDDYVPDLGKTLGEALLTPTRIYTKCVLSMTIDLPVLGLAHITGGGIVDNVLRILPKGCGICLKKKSWEIPPIFSFLQKAGNISQNEMMRTFNNGIGMIAVLPEPDAQETLDRLAAMEEKAFIIGEVTKRSDSKPRVKWS
jgi:phosphoribosylformylglycinamidine cyclo-ligase